MVDWSQSSSIIILVDVPLTSVVECDAEYQDSCTSPSLQEYNSFWW